ncbi:MAG: PDZ domain-containing protein [Dehalococcoidia bacterium]
MAGKRTRIWALAVGSVLGLGAIVAATSTVLIAHGDSDKPATAATAARTRQVSSPTPTPQPAQAAPGAGQGAPRQVGRAYLGVQIDTSNNKLTVQQVEAGGPAEKAGMKTGDVIVSIDGATTATYADLTKALAARKPGDVMTLSVDRGGSKQDISVTLGTRPARSSTAPQAQANDHGYLGVTVTNADAAAKQKYSLTSTDGALIVSASTDGAAAKAGLKAGDLITSVNSSPVKNTTDLRTALQNTKPGDSATVAYLRGAASQTVTLTLGTASISSIAIPGYPSTPGKGRQGGLPGIGAHAGGFDRFISSETKTKDASGTIHTDTRVAGTVKSASASQVVVTLNGGGDQTYTIDASTKIFKGFRTRAQATDLAQNDKVLVTTRDGSSTATAIVVAGGNGSGFGNIRSILGGGNGNNPIQIHPGNGGIQIRVPGGQNITVPLPGRGNAGNAAPTPTY